MAGPSAIQHDKRVAQMARTERRHALDRRRIRSRHRGRWLSHLSISAEERTPTPMAPALPAPITSEK
jgi:hypothetical protein